MKKNVYILRSSLLGKIIVHSDTESPIPANAEATINLQNYLQKDVFKFPQRYWGINQSWTQLN